MDIFLLQLALMW